MSKLSHQLAAAVFFACALLCGCDAHVDLNHIDPAAKVEMGVALPVGEFSATIGDFLGDTTVKQIKINEEGLYQFEDTFSFTRRFHDMDMSSYVALVTEELDVYSKVQGYTMVGGQTYVLDYPITVAWEELNTQTRRERIDSMKIRDAKFTVKLDQNFDIEFDRIKKIELILSDDFTRAAGKTMELPISSYGTETEIHVDNFCLNFMKDKSQPASGSNVKNTVSFNLRFEVRLNEGETMTLQPGDAFQTFVNASLLDYEALYGYFIQSEEMMETNTLSISEQWSGYYKIRQLNVSLADPSIDFTLTTPVAAAIRCKISNLKVENKDRTQVREADFNGSKTFEVPLPNYLHVTDPIGAVCSNSFTFTDANSGLGHMAEIHPEYLSYDYSIMSETRDEMTQQRLIYGMNYVDGKAAVKVPFKFNQGTKLEYKDTASVNLDKVSLDSLVADIEQVDSINVRSLHMVLAVSNMLPFNISGSFRFLDADYRELELNATAGNTVSISGPSEYDSNGLPVPGKGYIDIAVNNKNLELLPKVKYIEYDATVEDAGAPASIYPVSLTPECGMKVHIGLTADVAAYLKLQFYED